MQFMDRKINNKKLPEKFDTILKNWLDINDDYWRKYKDDALFYYNERASISILAGAIWRNGDCAMEEFSSLKGSSRNTRLGRVDLWFMLGDQEYIVEAKQRWPPFYDSDADLDFDFKQSLKTGLEEAFTDASDLRYHWENYLDGLIGLLFVVPRVAPTYAESSGLAEEIMRFIKTVEEADADFYAYLFNDEKKLIGTEGHICPGVALLGKLVPSNR